MQLLRPESVSPLVAWLCHESCYSTGGLFEVGAGWISRVRWERSAGAYFDPAGFSADEVEAAWSTINDFSDATHPTHTGVQVDTGQSASGKRLRAAIFSMPVFCQG